VVEAGQFSDLTVTPAGLYAVVTSGETFSQVVRLDKADGHVVFRSRVLAVVGNLSVTSTALWVTAATGGSVEPRALFRLDLATLDATRVGGVGNPAGTASDGADRLWVTAGCTLTRLDPIDGTVVARVTLPPVALGTNGCMETAAVSASMLFVSVYTSEETFSLQARTADTGALVDSTDLGDVGPSGVSLAPVGPLLVGGVRGERRWGLPPVVEDRPAGEARRYPWRSTGARGGCASPGRARTDREPLRWGGVGGRDRTGSPASTRSPVAPKRPSTRRPATTLSPVRSS
jgi:hypothetical protein